MKTMIFPAAFFFIVTSAYAQTYVGIGTTSPETKLHVVDTVNTADGAAGAFINLQNATVTSPIGVMSGIRFRLDGVNSGINTRFKGGIFFQKTNLFGVGTLLFVNNSTGDNSSATATDARMAITSTGNVGIGIVTPNYKLHIATGDLFVQSSAGRIIYGYDGGNQWRYSTTGGGADLLMSSFNGSTETYKHYFSQNGDVGIGIGSTAPVARLDLKTSSSSSGTSAMMIRNSSGDTLIRVRDNGYVGIGYNGSIYGRPLNIEGNGVNFYYDVNTFGGSIFPDVSNDLVLWSNNSGPGQNVVLQPSWGQVTMGTYTPATGYKLSVKGKVICEEAKVQLSASWPDYVFKSDYPLMTIPDLEKSIRKEQHLPNIPAAADMEKNGIMLGDMNRRIIEKVEELTLYIIDLNKQNEQLRQEVDQLKKQVNKN